MEDILDQYHEAHEVSYELRAIVDGEVVATYTDPYSFDNVSGYADLGDEKILTLAMKERIQQQDEQEQIEEDNLLEQIRSVA